MTTTASFARRNVATRHYGIDLVLLSRIDDKFNNRAKLLYESKKGNVIRTWYSSNYYL